MLRMATVLGPRGVSMTALKGRSWPFSTYTRILRGVLSGPCQSSMSASRGRPSVLSETCTCSTAGGTTTCGQTACTRMEVSDIAMPGWAATAPPVAPAHQPILTSMLFLAIVGTMKAVVGATRAAREASGTLR